MLVKTKGLTLGFLCLLAVVFAASPSLAEKKMKYKGKVILVTTKSTIHRVGDMKGHVIGVSTNKGVDLVNKTVWNGYVLWDVVNFRGLVQGWLVIIYHNKDKIFCKWKTRMVPKRTPEGMKIMFTGGTWIFTGGTGKWKGVQGSGTWHGLRVGKGVSSLELEGEYMLKK